MQAFLRYPVRLYSSSCLLIFLFGMTAALSFQSADTALQKGSQMVQEGRFQEAVELLREYRIEAPSDPRSYFYSAMAQMELANLTQASSEIAEAVRLAPEKLEYRILQANILVRLQHKTLALQALEPLASRIAALETTDAWKWLLSDTYYRLEKNDEALRVLDSLLESNPENPRIYLNRGQALRARGDLKAARESLERSLALAPEGNATAYFELGEVRRQLNEKEGALDAYRKAVEQNPGEAEYQFRLGIQHLDVGNVDDAIRWLEKAKPAGDSIPEIYYGLGRAYRISGDIETSRQYLKRFQQHNAEQREKDDRERQAAQKINQGELALEDGRIGDALLRFREAAEIDPGNWTAHGYQAELYLAEGQMENAWPHLEKIHQLDPDSPVGNYLMADYWFQRGDYKAALQFAEKVRALRPANARLRNLLGNIYLELGRREEARKEYRMAVELAPERSDFRANLESVERE